MPNPTPAHVAALAQVVSITPETHPWLYEHQCVACKKWGNTHIGNSTCFDDRSCCDDAPDKRVFIFTGPDDLHTAREHNWRLEDWMEARGIGWTRAQALGKDRVWTFIPTPSGNVYNYDHTAALVAAIERIAMDKPAFPCEMNVPMFGGMKVPGMTLREYAAVAAMQGLLANGEMIDSGDTPKWVADTAVSHADALLARLEES